MILRTIAVALLIAAWLIIKWTVPFAQKMILQDPVLVPTAFIIGCLGIGLALAGIFYPLLERIIGGFFYGLIGWRLLNLYNTVSGYINDVILAMSYGIKGK